MTEMLNYSLENTDGLDIPIQNIHSLFFERLKFSEIREEDIWRIDQTPYEKLYEKQRGNINILRKREKRVLNLGKIEFISEWKPFRRISDEAIRATFGNKF